MPAGWRQDHLAENPGLALNAGRMQMAAEEWRGRVKGQGGMASGFGGRKRPSW